MDFLATIDNRFAEHAAQRPEDIAIISAGLSVTYGELNQQVNQLAHYLKKSGVKADTLVALCMERSLDLIITLYAILKAGGAYVPLDPSHPQDRLLQILTNSETPFLITKSSIKDQFKDYSGTHIILDNTEEISQQPTHNPEPSSTTNHLAYVIHTSGSTGKPKGVLIEHQSVVNYSLWFADYCNSQLQQKIDFSSNYIFDMSVTCTTVPLMLGLTLVICSEEEKSNLRHYLNYLNDNEIQIIKISPSYFKLLLHEVQHNPCPLPHLQHIILGGENLPTNDCNEWLSLYPSHSLYNEYGPTEATVAVTQHKLTSTSNNWQAINVPIGTPGNKMTCYILNPDLSPVTPGDTGELYIGGLGLARGYLNQPELTAQKFITHPVSKQRLYQTGDLCKQRQNTIECLGRIDEQVKIRGFRIEPGEIENHFKSFPGICDIKILVREEEQHGKRLIAYYLPSDHKHPPLVADLQAFIKKRVPNYMLPSAFVRLNAFPLTANGKLDKAALPIPQYTNNQHFIAPNTELEKSIAAIWSEELGVKPIGIEDDFYELGGHSLSAARIISRINHVLKKDLSLNDFYHALTVAKLAKVVAKASELHTKTQITAYANQQILPFSHFQSIFWLANRFEPKVSRLNVLTRKRMQGQLDMKALQFAFDALLKKHECLSYQILTFRPAQKIRRNLPFTIIEQHLENLSIQDCEVALEDSFNELVYYHPWNKKAPLLLAKLFYLPQGNSELQLCMPHIISDDVSLEIIVNELSNFYHLYFTQTDHSKVAADTQYRDYLFTESHYSHHNLDRDITFWQNYLKDVSLFTIQPEHIIEDMNANEVPYSTYLEIPEAGLNRFQKFCASNHVTINDGLCAVLALALSKCNTSLNHENPTIFMNRVKSSRDQDNYDHTIGCFLRVDPIKIKVNKKSNLQTLSKQINKSAIETHFYQQCSSLVKLACLGEFKNDTNRLKSLLIKMLLPLYSKLFPNPKLNPKMLAMFSKLSAPEKKKRFVINLNVQNNFIAGGKRKPDAELFGLQLKKINWVPYDLLKINYVLDVCLIRTDSTDLPYLVISANLSPIFRERIAKEMMRIIQECLTTESVF